MVLTVGYSYSHPTRFFLKKNLVHLASSSAAQCVGPLLGSSGGARFGLDWVTTAVAIVVVACAAAVGGMGAAPDAVQRRLML